MFGNNVSCEDSAATCQIIIQYIYFIVLHYRLVYMQPASQNTFSRSGIELWNPPSIAFNAFPASLMYLAFKSSIARIELAGMAGKKRSLSSASWKSADKLWHVRGAHASACSLIPAWCLVTNVMQAVASWQASGENEAKFKRYSTRGRNKRHNSHD